MRRPLEGSKSGRGGGGDTLATRKLCDPEDEENRNEEPEI